MTNYFNRNNSDKPKPGHPATSLPSTIHADLKAISARHEIHKEFKTAGDLADLFTLAHHHPIFGISQWQDLSSIIHQSAADAYKQRRIQTDLCRRSIRIRDLQAASPNTYADMMDQMNKYKINTRLTPINLITPPFQDFRNSKAELPGNINITLNNYY
jgi:hypothetical protein